MCRTIVGLGPGSSYSIERGTLSREYHTPVLLSKVKEQHTPALLSMQRAISFCSHPHKHYSAVAPLPLENSTMGHLSYACVHAPPTAPHSLSLWLSIHNRFKVYWNCKFRDHDGGNGVITKTISFPKMLPKLTTDLECTTRE